MAQYRRFPINMLKEELSQDKLGAFSIPKIAKLT